MLPSQAGIDGQRAVAVWPVAGGADFSGNFLAFGGVALDHVLRERCSSERRVHTKRGGSRQNQPESHEYPVVGSMLM